MFGYDKEAKGPPRTPKGYRAYAVGDVHGRLDLLELLLADIERDMVERPSRRSLLVFLGDLIDRGSSSRGVIELLRTFHRPGVRPVFLAGNHEEVLLRLLAGERGLFADWLKYGGAECLASYGVDPTTVQQHGERAALARLKAAIPASHRQFMASFVDTLRFGDYLFVHAGIRPDVDLTLQTQSDLRWIRQPFLGDERDHGFLVIHGHTITTSVDECANRIGLDTGAYRTGVLTAIALDGCERRYFSAKKTHDGAK
ncbi:MAG: metallophosphoesterase [Sphingomonas sp.]|uniref:metallophosphoesterase n=1 Tax=Sphingomonas sp. TaxID=28214 RepID=UPI0017B436D2|nr:metallophosphoesterase [Sphingomonas sp.]MBA3666248.1 metallophosphoesterase [Sphingomonas sp.]